MATSTANAIVKPNAASLQQVLEGVQFDPAMLAAAKAIQAMGGTDKDGNYKITADLAMAAVIYQMGTGQMLGRDFYVDGRMGRMEGYRGVQRDAADRNVGMLRKRFRPLTEEELAAYEIRPGDTTVACEIYQIKVQAECITLGVPYDPIVGIGIWRDEEKYTNRSYWGKDSEGRNKKINLPRDKWQPIVLEAGQTFYGKAKIRAEKEAYRHTPGMNVSDQEVFAEAAVEHGLVPPERRMSVEDAMAWVESALREQEYAAELAELSPEQLQDRAKRNADEMGDDSRAAAERAGLHPAKRGNAQATPVKQALAVVEEVEEAVFAEVESKPPFEIGTPTMSLDSCNNRDLVAQWIADITHLPLRSDDKTVETAMTMLTRAWMAVGKPKSITAEFLTEVVLYVTGFVGSNLSDPSYELPTEWIHAASSSESSS